MRAYRSHLARQLVLVTPHTSSGLPVVRGSSPESCPPVSRVKCGGLFFSTIPGTRYMCSKGYRVVVADMNPTTGEKVASALGPDATFIQANIPFFEEEEGI
ncbi:hypothetical protein BDU57DRAFT_20879 [Ampelomyces quisqualis]|uniref:Uncharacterized protein n=1 Tax=Ampelomyces quisqualis TaxID=50730 RepID=A0A6A5QYW7_AMPQU|nr:hypothetical protein BDU57DRAFT_20879 [Ampelomyces quisqualis]